MRFGRSPVREPETGGRPDGFAWLESRDVYLDAACQSLRPRPVIDALAEYYTAFGACGGRVKYAWGSRVDEEVDGARNAVLALLGLSRRTHAVSFTLNTTYGLNLLLGQLPSATFGRVVTSHTEHNSVFLPTMTAARRLGVERLVLDRSKDGALAYGPAQLERAVVVVNAVSNVDGSRLGNLAELVRDTHERGGIVLLDAAQAVPHAVDLLHSTGADAICFSGHKAYAPTLGVVVARQDLLARLEVGFIGGGMVSDGAGGRLRPPGRRAVDAPRARAPGLGRDRRPAGGPRLAGGAADRRPLTVGTRGCARRAPVRGPGRRSPA